MITVIQNASYEIAISRFDNFQNVVLEPGIETELDDATANYLLAFRPSGITDVNGDIYFPSDIELQQPYTVGVFISP